MRCLVTGAAGFIGSHLAERLLLDGWDIVGVDCFTNYYSRQIKERNLCRLRQESRFKLFEVDLATADLAPLLDGVEAVFHHAAQAGVRSSWGVNFSDYTQNNVLATQRLLEAVKGRPLKKFVYASSSSVYGETPDLPMKETSLPKPYSPYGVTKLAGEQMCDLYQYNFGVPVVSLRYFTIYGPRQRPDMAFNRFFRLALSNQPISLYGDGEQTRNFTFVHDVIEANILAMSEGVLGTFNVSGDSRVTLNQVLNIIEEISSTDLRIEHTDGMPGDVRDTWADTTRARQILGFSPTVTLAEGLAAQLYWQTNPENI
jgi:nucleoside-diphosphate-sugar epimerase